MSKHPNVFTYIFMHLHAISVYIYIYIFFFVLGMLDIAWFLWSYYLVSLSFSSVSFCTFCSYSNYCAFKLKIHSSSSLLCACFFTIAPRLFPSRTRDSFGCLDWHPESTNTWTSGLDNWTDFYQFPSLLGKHSIFRSFCISFLVLSSNLKFDSSLSSCWPTLSSCPFAINMFSHFQQRIWKFRAL